MRSQLTASIPLAVTLLGLAAPTRADGPPSSDPPSVPLTRPEMKQFLENSKRNAPRLPLPPLTAEEQAKAERGDWTVVNNGRMRRHYLPAELAGGGLSGLTRDADPAMTLGYPFHTMLFWIVSRGNNCAYCMGHQESKLADAGVAEDRIAALDGDWSGSSEAERAAFGFARKLTFEPNRIGPDDIDGLRRHYNDRQVLEIVLAVSNFNSMNRWTGTLNIPQEQHRVYLTPTSTKFRDQASRVAPPVMKRPGSSSVCAVPAHRPPLETRAEVEGALAACRSQSPRLPLMSEAESRALLPSDWPSGPLPEWVRLLANFPRDGVARIKMHRAAEEKGVLDARLKAQIAWVAARNDRAWYALGHARRRLLDLGQTDDAIFALDQPGNDVPPADRAALELARKLTVNPALITDEDIAGLRKLYSDREVAEIVFQITEAAFFDRLTEAAGLALEK